MPKARSSLRVYLFVAAVAAIALGGVLESYALYLRFAAGSALSAAQQASTQRLADELARGSGTRTPGAPAALPGQATAVVRIPALGRSWQYPVYEGTGDTELGKGLAHYLGTAGPGGVGNYALAGHRSSLAGFEPFADLPDLIHPGDEVIVSAPAGVFHYRVTATENVDPSAVQVLAADQGRRADPSRRLITLTTCTPRFGHSGRFVVFGQLARPRG